MGKTMEVMQKLQIFDWVEGVGKKRYELETFTIINNKWLTCKLKGWVKEIISAHNLTYFSNQIERQNESKRP